jgi:hypothetical protein
MRLSTMADDVGKTAVAIIDFPHSLIPELGTGLSESGNTAFGNLVYQEKAAPDKPENQKENDGRVEILNRFKDNF